MGLTKLKWKAELLFWVISCLLVLLFLWPVWSTYGLTFEFYEKNAVACLVFFTFSRYLFLFKYVPFSHQKWVKGVLFFLCIPLFLYLLDGLYDFIRFIDEAGIQDLDMYASLRIQKYTRLEYIFFLTGSLIATLLFPMRLLVSMWRQINTDTI